MLASLRRPRALPSALLLEAALLLLCGGIGLAGMAPVRPDLVLLASDMGIQNATSTSTSTSLGTARVRTTPVTGIAADVGIGLGEMARALLSCRGPVRPIGARIIDQTGLLLAFGMGALIGAWSFARLETAAWPPFGMLALLLPLLWARPGAPGR